MRRFYFRSAAVVLVLAAGLSSRPAFAQLANSPSGNMQAPTLQPKSDGDQTLPPAVPGAGGENLSTAPNVAKAQTGDPTTQLFNAINGNDYTSAQDAISRGADLNGQNALGETPIDLSVGLNRNSITFMLLAARSDSGDGQAVAGPMPAGSYVAAKPSVAVPVKLIETPRASPGNNPGMPNPSAGFLGFGK